MAQTVSAFGATPTAEDWEARRSWITQLYRDEDKPLKDVMALVNVDGFKATTKMYKVCITKWGLDKKNKKHEAGAILRVLAQRVGKPTQISLRGRPVDVNKIEYYFKRKGILIEDVIRSDSPPPSDMDLICRTPSPVASPVMMQTMEWTQPSFRGAPPASNETQVIASEAIPRRIEAPDGLKIVEYLFADIREYMIGCCAYGFIGLELMA